MWHEIRSNEDVKSFMEQIYYFHDSCIKEMRYISGAYVTEKLSMYPINAKRSLSVIVQRQFEDIPVLELEFAGLDYMNLRPVDPGHTCEILDATLLIKGGRVYWCDLGGLSEDDLDSYNGTLICAEKLRWRAI